MDIHMRWNCNAPAAVIRLAAMMSIRYLRPLIRINMIFSRPWLHKSERTGIYCCWIG
jgi:hypothetical protein